jgi:hypothetical protein
MQNQGRRCGACGGELEPFEHRAPGSEHKDQSLCFNGIPKAGHICVATCSKPGLVCSGCRMLVDLSGQQGEGTE